MRGSDPSAGKFTEASGVQLFPSRNIAWTNIFTTLILMNDEQFGMFPRSGIFMKGIEIVCEGCWLDPGGSRSEGEGKKNGL
jgi:hypothetical protein